LERGITCSVRRLLLDVMVLYVIGEGRDCPQEDRRALPQMLLSGTMYHVHNTYIHSLTLSLHLFCLSALLLYRIQAPFHTDMLCPLSFPLSFPLSCQLSCSLLSFQLDKDGSGHLTLDDLKEGVAKAAMATKSDDNGYSMMHSCRLIDSVWCPTSKDSGPVKIVAVASTLLSLVCSILDLQSLCLCSNSSSYHCIFQVQ
jgi:hypothetical protein